VVAVASGAVGAWINDTYFSGLEKDQYAYVLANDARTRVHTGLAIVASVISPSERTALTADTRAADQTFERRRWDDARGQYVAIEAEIREVCPPNGPPECSSLPFSDPELVEPP
jgi:hypothetical protein